MKVVEVIEKVKANGYWSIYDFDEAFAELEVVEEGIGIDTHRWYETSCSIYKCEDGFVKVRGVSTIFSESMAWEDCGFKCVAEECFPVSSVKYLTKSEMEN